MNLIDKIDARRALYEKQNGKCHWCGRQMMFPNHRAMKRLKHPRPANMPTIDHVVPLSRGGDDRRSNLVLACLACNGAHANTLPIERELGL